MVEIVDFTLLVVVVVVVVVVLEDIPQQAVLAEMAAIILEVVELRALHLPMAEVVVVVELTIILEAVVAV